MPDKTRPKAAKLTPENIDESAKLKALWNAAKLKLGKRLTQAEFGATYGIGEQGMVWQCLNGRGAAISLNAARGFVRGLREMADMAITIEDFSPRLAAEAAKNSQFAPVASETTTRLPVVRAAEEPHAGYVRLPVLAEAAGGDGREPLPEVVQYVDVLESYLRQRLHVNPKTIAVLTARGGSMAGVIEDGDVMFVLPTNEFTDDGIYVLSLDGLVRVKRLSVSMIAGVVSIESNDGRQAEHLPLKEVPHRLHIQGRVIGAWSLRKFS